MNIGKRIRQFREQQGKTIRQLAKEVGISDSYISQLEHEKVNPSVGTLKKLSLALNINMVDFFSAGGGDEDILVKKEQRREIVYPGGKIRAQVMASRLSSKTMEPLYTIIEPGGDTIDPYKHGEDGEEFGVIIKGELMLTVDGTDYHLKEGDAFYFKSNRFHRWANPGTVTTEIVWVITPPTF